LSLLKQRMKCYVVTLLSLLSNIFSTALPLQTLGASEHLAERVPQWTRYEAKLTSSLEYANPVQDIEVEVEFTSP
jgi:hypothetical protein